ncbi:hypothetical protein FPT12_20485 [Pseudomonas sp. H3(2019)]|nr:hypothetical protein FPT12_20485 [Pseudomonas sp. H3(2019)]
MDENTILISPCLTNSQGPTAPPKPPVKIWGHITQLTSCTDPVGASLLAMRVCQSTSMLNVRPQSRAGSLPQGICVRFMNPCCLSHGSGRRPWSNPHPVESS